MCCLKIEIQVVTKAWFGLWARYDGGHFDTNYEHLKFDGTSLLNKGVSSFLLEPSFNE